MTAHRVAVCGSVDWTDAATIESVLDGLLVERGALTVLTGMAEGADQIARAWAARNGVEVVAECLDPGPYPGPMHAYNEWLIGLRPDVVIAFKEGFDGQARPNGYEPGTEHLIRLAAEAGIATAVHERPAGRPGRVIRAPAAFADVPAGALVVFLAGTIDQGASVDWQAGAGRRFAAAGAVVLNPRRVRWDAALPQRLDEPQFRAQLEWEAAGLERADLIVMWLAPESRSPVSLLELGLYADSARLIVGCPPGFWRHGNVDFVCRNRGIECHDTLDDLITASLDRIRT